MSELETLVREAQDSFRDSVATMDKQGKRIWIHPQKPKGRFHNARKIFAVVLLILLFVTPFIKVNGEPLLLFNLPERKFIIFSVVFWPQDFFLFGLGMLVFFVSIVLFTTVFGRLWCGWACPQTIFMEMVFRKVEYWIEGDAAHQRALKKQAWNNEKILKRTAKHTLFILISLIISNLLLSYIIGVDELFKIVTEPVNEHLGGFIAMLAFTGVFYFVFAWFREQACTVVCPYGRLQGVLLVKESIVVAYDYIRGEPRRKFKKNAPAGQGDCIDCMQCVKVCPTGIDIRNGTQLECVNCTACIDACDHMMDKVGKPRGLIRLASEKNIAEGKKFSITPRVAGYSAVLVILTLVLGFLLFTRSELDATILRTPGLLYQEQGKDHISNLYTIKLVNKTHKSLPASIRLEGIEGEIQMAGKNIIHVQDGGIGESAFFIIIPRHALSARKTTVNVGIYAGDEKLDAVETTFLAPENKQP